ncbi:MAG: cytochrome b/b6 domain-containing protein [Deltaproteobacteria bacterium]|nr:cytochrome b/b6 domain-containing protein [Deltaproteobacteria bacterium]
MQVKQRIYLTPTPIRIWHWLNAFGITTLCLTGAEISFPEYISLFGNFKAAVRVHNAAGTVVAVSFALWFIYYAFVARSLIRTYVPTAGDLSHGLLRQALYYFFYFFRGSRPNPHHQTPEDKFNPLQKSAYMAIMLILTPLVIITGVFLMNVAPLRGLVLAIGGLKILVAVHWLLACSFCAFLFVHIYLATLGHTPFAHFKPMWTGWEEIENEHQDDSGDPAANAVTSNGKIFPITSAAEKPEVAVNRR